MQAKAIGVLVELIAAIVAVDVVVTGQAAVHGAIFIYLDTVFFPGDAVAVVGASFILPITYLTGRYCKGRAFAIPDAIELIAAIGTIIYKVAFFVVGESG